MFARLQSVPDDFDIPDQHRMAGLPAITRAENDSTHIDVCGQPVGDGRWHIEHVGEKDKSLPFIWARRRQTTQEAGASSAIMVWSENNRNAGPRHAADKRRRPSAIGTGRDDEATHRRPERGFDGAICNNGLSR